MSETQFTLTDDSLMYFGKHKGEKLANLPDSYCVWLLKQDWIKEHEGLYNYLLEMEELLK